jgi:hypothetical protein
MRLMPIPTYVGSMVVDVAAAVVQQRSSSRRRRVAQSKRISIEVVILTNFHVCSGYDDAVIIANQSICFQYQI